MQLKDISSGSIVATNSQIEWVGGVWECGNVRFTDADQSQYAVVPDVPVAPKLAPIEFKLCFTITELVAIETSTDPAVKVFYGLVQSQENVNASDPTRGLIDLGLKSTQDAIAYLVHTGILTQARADAILTGTPV